MLRIKIWSHLMGNHEQPERAVQECQSPMTALHCSVYGLFSTEDMVVRYIGQTMQSLPNRRVQHLAEAARPPGTSRCHRWIRKVLRSGFEIGIDLIEEECQWDDGEKYWIAFYRDRYPGQLTNLSAGGCGYVGKRSMATRLKMSKPKSAETRAKMRKPKSAEARANMSLALAGNRRSIGEAHGKAVLTEEAVVDIKRQIASGASLSRIAAMHGVTKATVWKIKDGRVWRSVQSA